MKKIFPVVLVLALALVLMIVPAFADTELYYSYDDEGTFVGNGLPSAGIEYSLVASCSAPEYGIESSIEGNILISETVDEFGDPILTGSLTGVTIDSLSDLIFNFTFASGFSEMGDPIDYCSVVCSIPDFEVTTLTLTPVSPAPEQPSPPTGDPADVFAIFSAIGDWLLDQIPVILVLFWNAETSQLTVLGGLAILFVGIGLTALLVALVRRFFKFA